MRTRTCLYLLLLLAGPLRGQNILNLGFEPDANRGEPLKCWYTQSARFTHWVDTVVKHSGKGSLRVEAKWPDETGFTAVYTLRLPLDSVRGKILTVSVKATAATVGKGIQLYVGTAGKQERFNDAISRDSIRQSGTWQELTVRCAVAKGADKHVAIGVRAFGSGTAWFDDLKIELDGVPYRDLPFIPADPLAAPVRAQLPTEAELQWLRNQVVPLQTVDPAAQFADLQVINPLIGQARVVGLGEVTHDSKEIFLMKHRLVRYLAEQKGFTLFALEADMTAARRVDEYVRNGKGDPRQLLAGLGFWTWNNTEVLNLIEWMRDHNRKAAPGVRVTFEGFDMQRPERGLDDLTAWARQYDTLLLTDLRIIGEGIQKIRATPNWRQRIPEQAVLKRNLEAVSLRLSTRIERLKERFLGRSSLEAFAWTRQQLALLQQFIVYQFLPMREAMAYRDACMAENLHWLTGHRSDAKTVLWAHNDHLRKGSIPFEEPTPMGAFLKGSYGEAYLSIGFAFHEGTYRAIHPQTLKLDTFTAQPSYPGTYEYYFKSAGPSLFLLDLRKPVLSKENQWLFEPLKLRTVGAIPAGDEYGRKELRKEFDLILFMRQSSTATAIKP